MKNSHLPTLFCCFFLLFSCTDKPGQVPPSAPSLEVVSLLGKPLVPPQEPPTSLAKKDSLLRLAQARYDSDPDNLDHIIWLGRRTAYLWRYEEAIALFSKGLERHPKSPELYRHRGHRYLTTRQIEPAIRDFEKAAALAKDRPLEIEPDGIPNKLNLPLSNLHFNIYYHLALAHYLKGDFEKAAQAYQTCMHWSVNPDLQVATADWLYMTYRRMGRTAQADSLLATIPTDWQLVENDGHYNRILLYKGLLQPEALLDFSKKAPDDLLNLVTQGYGVANWHLCNGDTALAFEVFNKILATDHWAGFGYLAAEAEVARRR